MLRVGIAGYGIVGKRRRECVDKHPKMKVMAVCDRVFSGNGLMEDGLRYYQNYQDFFLQLISLNMSRYLLQLP